MPDTIYICQVCLRTDIKLKVIDPRLSDFHEELCDYSYYSFNQNDPQFCMECEHLLKKLYNFKEKCVLAVTVLQKWKNKKGEKNPLNLLYTLVPQCALGVWMPSNTKVLNFEEEPKPVANDSTLSSDRELNLSKLAKAPNNITPLVVTKMNMLKPIKVSKLSIPRLKESTIKLSEPSVDVPRPLATNVNVPRPLATSVNVPRRLATNVNVPRSLTTSVNVPRRLVISVNVPRPVAPSVNVPTPLATSVNIPRPLETTVPGLKSLERGEVQSSQLEIPLPVEKFSITDNSQHLDNGSNQGRIETPIPTTDIKMEIDCEDDLQLIEIEDVIKTEEVTVPYFKIVPEYKYNAKKFENKKEKIIELQIKDDTKTVDSLDETILNSDDTIIEIDTDLDEANIKNSDDENTDKIHQDYTTLTHVEDIETDSSINSDDFREIDKALDDSSVEGDDNDEKALQNVKDSPRNQKSLAELANITLTDDDFIDNDETEIQEEVYASDDDDDDDNNEEWTAVNKVIADMENMNGELDSMYDNFEKILLESGNIIQKKYKATITKRTKIRNMIGFGIMISQISEHMDDLQENCENIVQVKDTPALIHKRIRQLKVNLRDKFESCGEVKSIKGVIIDKEHLLNCIDGRVSKFLLETLWKAVNYKQKLTPKAIKILEWIQNKYQKTKYESVFDIEFMNTPEAMREEFEKRKTYPWYIKAKFKCDLCYTVFKFDKHLTKHKRMHEESAGEFICSICGVRHHLKSNNKKHLLFHEIVYKCKQCHLVTYNKNTMMRHYDQHKGVTYKCEPCDKTFASASAYYTHRVYEHRRAHVCTTCGRTFETEVILDTHKKTHRGEAITDGGTSVACDECALSFPSQAVYERHLRFSHANYLPWGKNQLRNSNRNKTGDKQGSQRIYKRTPFTCPECKAVGNSYGWLMFHGRMKHKKDFMHMFAAKRKYLCDVCGKGFMTKYSLRDHLNTHTGERPFPCGSCPKRFQSNIKLQHHLQYHHPPTRLCTHCGKKFHTHSNLYNHMRAHIGERRYKCDICGKGFLCNATLREHIRGVHNNVRRVRKRGGTGTGGRGGTENGGKGGTNARATRTTVARKKRRMVVSSTDESSDSEYLQCS